MDVVRVKVERDKELVEEEFKVPTAAEIAEAEKVNRLNTATAIRARVIAEEARSDGVGRKER